MPLAIMRANGAFSQRSLSIFGNAGGAKRQNWHGDAVRGAFARANATSSAAAENAKDLWRPEGQKRPERENRQGY